MKKIIEFETELSNISNCPPSFKKSRNLEKAIVLNEFSNSIF
jgi:hypothetical protein